MLRGWGWSVWYRVWIARRDRRDRMGEEKQLRNQNGKYVKIDNERREIWCATGSAWKRRMDGGEKWSVKCVQYWLASTAKGKAEEIFDDQRRQTTIKFSWWWCVIKQIEQQLRALSVECALWTCNNEDILHYLKCKIIKNIALPAMGEKTLNTSPYYKK